MYQNYVFDLYGTLLDIRTNENNPYLWKKISEIYAAIGAFYTPSELKKTFRKIQTEQEKKLPENGEIDLRQVFADLLLRKGVNVDPAVVRTIGITFRSLSRNRLCVYEGVYETLQELKERGKGIYLLSNAQSDFTRPELAMTGLAPYFDGILISSEVGYKKPASEFYKYLFETFELDPGKCLMIGNDESSDIAGAVLSGMDSLYIHTEISPRTPLQGVATYCIMDGDWNKVRTLLRNLN